MSSVFFLLIVFAPSREISLRGRLTMKEKWAVVRD